MSSHVLIHEVEGVSKLALFVSVDIDVFILVQHLAASREMHRNCKSSETSWRLSLYAALILASFAAIQDDLGEFR